MSYDLEPPRDGATLNEVNEYLRVVYENLRQVISSNGVSLPKVSDTEKAAIVNPPNGLTIYNTTTNTLEARKAGAWVTITTS